MKTYNISQLICSKFSSGSDCNIVSEVLATGLLRTSATRIFSDPKQSFCEIVSNSIDAYGVGNSIGRFGMGFISNLFWIYERPEKSIVVESHTLDEDWIGKIYYDDGFKLDFEENLPNQKFKSTKITFDGFEPDSDFREEIPNMIKTMFCSVQDVNIKIIKHDCEINDEFWNNNPESDKIILIEVGLLNSDCEMNDKITFYDEATGISKYVFLNAMLIPATTTKINNHYVEEKPSKNLCDVFGIRVNNILVVPVPKLGVFIDMPHNTKLTVSRDDILISTQNDLINLASSIQKIIKYDQNLSKIVEGLESYVKFTDQNIIKKLIMEIINQTLKNSKVILVPKIYDIYYSLENKIIVERENADNIEISYLLEHKYKNSIIDTLGGKKIIVLDDLNENYTQAGTNQFIFVRRDFYEKENYKTIICITNVKNFIPFDSKSDKLYFDMKRNYEKVFGRAFSFVENIYSSFYRFLNNHTNRNDDFMNLQWLLVKIKNVYEDKYISNEDKIKYFSKLYLLISNSSPQNRVYGSENFFEFKEMGTLITYNNQFNYVHNRIRPIPNDMINLFIHINSKLLDLYIKMDEVLYFHLYKFYNKMDFIFYFKYNYDYTRYVTSKVDFEMALIILTCIYMYEFGKKKMKLPVNALDYIINETILRIPWDTKTLIANDFNEHKLIYHYKIIEVVLNLSYFINRIGKYENRILNIKHSVLLSNMIDYVIRNDIIVDNLDWIYKIETNKINQDSNIIHIACNTGTTKDIIPAIMTELIQNSRDAILVGGSIELKLTYDGLNTVLTVHDDTGIPFKAFPSLLIPFLSSKKPGRNTVGQMGTGFFNVYRQPICEKVIITTKVPGENETVCIEGTPVIENETVIDINYRVCTIESVQKGTDIDVFLRGNMTLEVFKFMNEVISTITDVPIYFEMTKINKLISYVVSLENYTIQIVNENMYIPSVIQVKGIPVIGINEVIDKTKHYININVANNIIVNLSFEILPTQGRNKLIIPDKRTSDYIQKIIADADYIYTLYNIVKFNRLTYKLFGLDSTSEVDQVLPARDVKGFGNHHFGDRNYSLIDGIYNTYENKNLDSYNDMELELIQKWFSNKTPIANKNIEHTEYELEELNQFVKIFWDIGRELFSKSNLSFDKDPPRMGIMSKIEGVEGYYHPIYNVLFIINPNNEMDKIKNDFRTLFNINSVEDRIKYCFTQMKYLFMVSYNLTVLIHEITHAFINTEEGSHDKFNFEFNGQTKTMEFEEIGHYVYSKIVEHDLFESWLKI